LVRYSLKSFDIQSKTAKKMSFEIIASSDLCYNNQAQASPNTLSSSTLLALFDELSTFSLFAFDMTRRPGVSVSLSDEIIRPIYEGEIVTMITTCDKIGLILAFISMEVRSDKGLVMARGKHIKYLNNMGWIWPWLWGSLLIRLTVIVYQWLALPKLKGGPVDGLFIARKKIAKATANGHDDYGYLPPLVTSSASDVFKTFTLTKLTLSSSALMTVVSVTVDANRHLNPVGSIQGGAVAVSIEAAIMLAFNSSSNRNMSVSGLEVRYLSPAEPPSIIVEIMMIGDEDGWDQEYLSSDTRNNQQKNGGDIVLQKVRGLCRSGSGGSKSKNDRLLVCSEFTATIKINSNNNNSNNSNRRK
jgi:acyl-coenzyme A thioesterase PaaI-like protein